MSYRVVQWSTGNVGRFCLRSIIQHPELELAGVWVHSEGKVGQDAGALCGFQDVGVLATNDIDAIVDLDADCVVYTSNGDVRPFEAAEEMARLLASGKNVVSTAIVPLVHPKTFNPDMAALLSGACAEGNTSFFNSGIDPGFANDVLPLALSGLSARWEEIRIQEIENYATYDRPEILFDVMGFGKPLDETPLLLTPSVVSFAWGGTIRLLAEGLGVELEDIREVQEQRPAEKDIAIGGHTVKAGTRGAMRFEVQGIVNGKPALVVEHVTRLDDALAPEWAQGSGGYRVIISGEPRIQADLFAEDENGNHAIGGVIVTATRVVNAIPAVCDADPGLLSALDLPLVSGKGLGPT